MAMMCASCLMLDVFPFCLGARVVWCALVIRSVLFPAIFYHWWRGSSSASAAVRARVTFYGETAQSNSAAHLFADLWQRAVHSAQEYSRGVARQPGVSLSVARRRAAFSFNLGVGQGFYARCRSVAAQRQQLDREAAARDPERLQLALVDAKLVEVARREVQKRSGKVRAYVRRVPKPADAGAFDAGKRAGQSMPTDNGRVKDGK